MFITTSKKSTTNGLRQTASFSQIAHQLVVTARGTAPPGHLSLDRKDTSLSSVGSSLSEFRTPHAASSLSVV